MSHPWTKHIFMFVSQSLGFNMTLGSFSPYIDLCPPPFGYPSKHMLPESDHLSCYFPREFLPNLSRPLYSLSLSLMLSHPKNPIKYLFEIIEVLFLIVEILLYVPQRVVEDLWVVHSYTHITLLLEF
jgi:hypothetical protein